MARRASRRQATVARLLLLPLVCCLCACSAVAVKSVSTVEYLATQRGDILSDEHLSGATRETLRITALSQGVCAVPTVACIEALSSADGVDEERRLSALSELWLQQANQGRAVHAPAVKPGRSHGPAIGASATPAERVGEKEIDAWLEAARYAYAYLFFTERTPGERAFEERQTQVRDYYNYAVQEATSALFRLRPDVAGHPPTGSALAYAGWTVTADLNDIRLPQGRFPRQLIPASSLSFSGLRNIYRRDGFGAELVAVMGSPLAGDRVFSEMPSPALTILFRFAGETRQQVLATREVQIGAYDPYRDFRVQLHGQSVPLAANFSSGYGLWLARSDFAMESVRTALGRDRGIEKPRVFMMQPYDPKRRIIVMLHGLASSPQAWVNVANEVLGDELLRQHFQVWQVYYPSNNPIAVNRTMIHRAIRETQTHFDPHGEAAASHGMVLVGHSMGGVIARLLLSSSGDRLWNQLLAGRDLDTHELGRIRPRLQPLLCFRALPGVSRGIFIAAPHRGTSIAATGLARWIAGLVRLPGTLLESFDDVLATLYDGADVESRHPRRLMPNSIDNLDAADPFIRVSAGLPIADNVRYHSIIAQRDPSRPLWESDDGLVPYWSSHLDGADSEQLVASGHGVQDTAQAILEIRRILHQDIEQYEPGGRKNRDTPTLSRAESDCAGP